MWKIKSAIGGTFTMLSLIFVLVWLGQHGTVDNKRNIEFIQAHCYNGKVIDMQNEVGVKSVKDIKWYYDDHDTIVIEYGKIALKYKISEFVTPEAQELLNTVFIRTEQNKATLDFILYWNDEEVTKYVKR